ncbi:MdlB ABC-type multidrug transport system, ATPase and permease components [actinobacterium SCGC AAA044-D11]
MNKVQASTFTRCFNLLSARDRKKLALASLAQILLTVLDLVGVALVGLIGALAVNGIQSQNPAGRTQKILSLFQIDSYQIQTQVSIIGLIAAAVLVSRTALSMILAKKILFFLAKRCALMSTKLTAGILTKSLLFIQSRSSQELVYAASVGVETVFLKVLASGVAFIADAALLFLMLLVLLVVDPIIALITLVLFLGVAVLLYYFMHSRAQYLGVENSKIEVAINDKMVEVLSSYREVLVHDRRGYYVNKISRYRESSFGLIAKINFLPSITKYVIELTLVIGSLLIGGIEFLINDAHKAVATIAIFMAVSSRIAPAVMRLQQSAIQIRSNLGAAELTIGLSEELGVFDEFNEVSYRFDSEYKGFIPSISVNDLTFTYPGSRKASLSGISFNVETGKTLAIVGKSGAGKTTLVDSLLGVLPIRSDVEIKISNVDPLEAFKKWPGAISYVPQHINLMAGTIKENICFGYDSDAYADNDYWIALEIAELADFVKSLPDGLEHRIIQDGSNLSGGQRQRLGIARAMFTKPKLLILDEATSALDNETERAVSKALVALSGKITIVVIAHRMTTIRSADNVLYLNEGRIEAFGDFNFIKSKIPNFDLDTDLTKD